MLFVAAHVGATPPAAEGQLVGLMPPGSERALSRWPFMNARKLAFNQTACDALREGTSVEDVDREYRPVATSDREIVFNLGSYKTGSSSLNEALESLGFHACKTAWNDLGGQFASFDMVSIAAFKASPISGDSPLHKAINRCTALGDAPWLFLFPTLMRAFPKAKFILTRQPSCEDWVYHVRGLWQWMGWLGEEQKWTTPLGKKYGIAGELNACWYGSWAPDATKLWHSRCVETERAIVKAARKLDRPLLVLPATWTDQEKWAALDQFLGTNSTALKGGQPDYPYHHTGELHGPNEEPPNAPVDENAHLWPEKPRVPNAAGRPNTELAAQAQCTAVSIGRLASLSGIDLWCYELATTQPACDKLHLSLGSRGYAKCVWRGSECTAEAFVEGFPPCREVTDVDEYLSVNSFVSRREKHVTPPLALGTQPNGGFSVPTKDIWDMYQCPDGAQSLKEHQSWLTRLGGTAEFDGYLSRVYGQPVSNVTSTSVSFFWDTVPRRADVKVWWAAWFCSKTKPATQPPGQLWAPLEDAIISPQSVHVADFKSCEALARAQNLRWSSAPSLDSLGPSTHAQDACDAALCALGMTEVRRSGCKLSHALVQCANRTAGRSADDFSFRACVAHSAMSRAPVAPVYFPGFFVRHSADFYFRAAGDVTRRLLSSAPLPEPNPHLSSSQKVGDTGVPDHTWVEVIRVGRLDDKNDAPDRATAGQVWFWLASGSGIWWSTGRTLVINEPKQGSGGGCAAAHKQGYDSIQVTRRGPTPTHPYSYEIMDCRLQGSAEANMTWASACPPPGVTLRSGMPAEAERFAPALEGKQLRARKATCHCDPQYSYLNCAG